MNEISRYEKYLHETFVPDYNEAVKRNEEVINELREYESLLVTIATMQRLKKDDPNARLKTLVNLGKHFYANAVADSNDRIIVRVYADLFINLPIERAEAFVEKRIRLLEDKANKIQELANKIKVHIDLVLASLDKFASLEKEKS